jgi:pimeloyl-ACP methyl ester carboxylesterase
MQEIEGGTPRFKTEGARVRYMAAYDAALSAWPVAYDELDIGTRFGSTHVIASGPEDAPPLILLHSLAATATVWRPNVEALSRHHRCYAVDIIGQCGKSIAIRRLTSRRDYAEWLGEIFTALGIARTSIVGCSFGAFLAMSQASLMPEQVDRVVLIGPAGTFVGLSWRFKLIMRTMPPLRRVRRLMGDTRPPDIAQFRPKGIPVHPEDAPWRALMAATIGQVASMNTIDAPAFAKSEHKRIRAPVLLLIGEKETLYDPQTTLRLAMARVPGLSGAVVDNADHIAAMAQPDDVNRRILDFLA